MATNECNLNSFTGHDEFRRSFRTEIHNLLPALRLIAIGLCLGVLIVGLWPFHAPRNEVSWSSQGDGLLFGRYGSIVSTSTFESRSKADPSCSMEIWLEPRWLGSGGTILAFYRPASRVVPFEIRQVVDGLRLRLRRPGDPAKETDLYAGRIFKHSQPILLSITSGRKGTDIYIDGVLAKQSESFRFSSEDLTGQLIVGNAPATSNNWVGKLRGLAIYDRELQAGEVSHRFAVLTKAGPSDCSENVGAVACYRFAEGKGNIAHNQLDSSTDLLIPERYFLLQEPLLEPVWRESHFRWSYWLDFGINIVGFIPLGLVFQACFFAIGIKRATWLAIASGFVVSLTIEVLQAFLPTRDSGMNDVISNTMGTAFGAILWTWTLKYGPVRAGIRFLSSHVQKTDYLIFEKQL